MTRFSSKLIISAVAIKENGIWRHKISLPNTNVDNRFVNDFLSP